MRVRQEVMRCERGYRGRHMAEGNKRREQEMRYNRHGGRLVRWGKGHMDQKRGDEQM
jgi:hypothetical protein